MIIGNLLKLRVRDAIDMVRRCRDERVPVLDIEGYILHLGGGVEPIADTIGLSQMSTDPSSLGNCWNLAEAFLYRYIDTPLLFNITIPRNAKEVTSK